MVIAVLIFAMLALQGAVNFVALGQKIPTIHFGLIGTYGQLSFTPKNMQDSK